MHLTTHELTLIPSAVAGIAIVGGYLGVRSANLNAMRIAREEREARQVSEQTDVRRTVYARFLAALTSTIDARRVPWEFEETPTADAVDAVKSAARTAYGEALKVFHEVSIVAPMLISTGAESALDSARNWKPFARETHYDYEEGLEELRFFMREDLGTPDDPSWALRYSRDPSDSAAG